MRKTYYMGFFLALAVLAGPGAALAEGAELGRFSFEGGITSEQWGTYIKLPFIVPEGTGTIKVSYSYSAEDGRNGIVDIGIYDPAGFRGWSGSSRSEFVVSKTRELTTEGYLPGEMPAGEWHVELGVPDIDLGVRIMSLALGVKPPKKRTVVNYRVEVVLLEGPPGEAFVAPAKQDFKLNSTPGWYAGDLHCHSTHSDGTHTLEQVLDFAHSQGLDFIAVTDHNTNSHLSFLPEMQQRYDDMLLLYGIEYTSYFGHANVFDYPEMMNYRAREPGYDINAVVDEIRDAGGYFSPNHPASFLSVGIPFKLDDLDPNSIDFYEVINGATRIFRVIPNPINLKAVKLWDRMLRDGHRITAIGGSDDHWAGQGDNPIASPIGYPATMVYARELSTPAIIEGLKAGHVYVLARGPSDMTIDFTASGGGQEVMMGDHIAADAIEYRVQTANARFKTLVIIENGLPRLVPITRDDFSYSFRRKPASSGYVRVEVRSGPFQEIVGNPIYYSPAGR